MNAAALAGSCSPFPNFFRRGHGPYEPPMILNIRGRGFILRGADGQSALEQARGRRAPLRRSVHAGGRRSLHSSAKTMIKLEYGLSLPCCARRLRGNQSSHRAFRSAGFCRLQESNMASTGTAIRSERAAPSRPFPNTAGLGPSPGLSSRSVAYCASCREPLPFTAMGISAWLADNRFFCNEFCADSALE
jgi:hypothetical protein